MKFSCLVKKPKSHDALYLVEGDEQPERSNSQTCMKCCSACAAYFWTFVIDTIFELLLLLLKSSIHEKSYQGPLANEFIGFHPKVCLAFICTHQSWKRNEHLYQRAPTGKRKENDLTSLKNKPFCSFVLVSREGERKIIFRVETFFTIFLRAGWRSIRACCCSSGWRREVRQQRRPHRRRGHRRTGPGSRSDCRSNYSELWEQKLVIEKNGKVEQFEFYPLGILQF